MFRYVRKILWTLLSLIKSPKYKSRPNVYGFSLFTRNTELGKNTSFNGFRIYGNGAVRIGDNFHSGAGCKVITQVHNYQGETLPYDATYRYKNIVIGDNVWFGMDVMILASCTIGEGAIIQAGAVIVSDIPPLSIAGGNPARVFSKRDSEHFYRLKGEGRFH